MDQLRLPCITIRNLDSCFNQVISDAIMCEPQVRADQTAEMTLYAKSELKQLMKNTLTIIILKIIIIKEIIYLLRRVNLYNVCKSKNYVKEINCL